jgi:hypothetical protein
MKKVILVIFLCHIILFGIFSCSSGSKTTLKKSLNSEIDFSIITGSGGGFTGSYEGYFIDSLSNVYKWTGKTFKTAEKVFLGKLNDEQTEMINKAIRENNILNIDMKEHGNVSSYILLENKEAKHSISWSGIEPGKTVPEGVRSFKLKLVQVFDALQKNK